MTRHTATLLLILFAGSSVGAEDPPRFFQPQQMQRGQVALYRDEWGMPHGVYGTRRLSA